MLGIYPSFGKKKSISPRFPEPKGDDVANDWDWLPGVQYLGHWHVMLVYLNK